MSEKAYTLEEITEAWTEYDSAQSFSVLSGGRWTHRIMKAGDSIPRHINGTRAEIRHVREIMSFPEFLEGGKWTPK